MLQQTIKKAFFKCKLSYKYMIIYVNILMSYHLMISFPAEFNQSITPKKLSNANDSKIDNQYQWKLKEQTNLENGHRYYVWAHYIFYN